MDGNFVVNEGYDYTDALSGEHMTHRSRYPVFPTNRGWAQLNSYSFVRTPPLPLGNSNQFTIEFECFTFYYTWMRIHFHPNVSELEGSSAYQYLWVEIDDDYAEVDSENMTYVYSSSFKIDNFKWNKIYVTFQKLENSSSFDIWLYKRVMLNNTSNVTYSYYDYWFTISSTYFPDFEELILSFFANDIILNNLKFYKYAMNFQTVIEDLGPYYDPATDNSNTNFANNYYSYYYYKFRSDSYSK